MEETSKKNQSSQPEEPKSELEQQELEEVAGGTVTIGPEVTPGPDGKPLGVKGCWDVPHGELPNDPIIERPFPIK